jgi:Trp operon repressor
MLRKEDWMYIKAQVEKGVYQRDIAEEVGVSPKTISRGGNGDVHNNIRIYMDGQMVKCPWGVDPGVRWRVPLQ